MLDRLVELGCPIDEVNVGGGLGAPARDDEQAIDLDAYAAVLARQLGPRGVARRGRAGRLPREGQPPSCSARS